MPSVHLWPSLAATAVLLLAIVVLVRGLIRTRTAPAPATPHDPRDGTAVDRMEQDLRALDWLYRQGRISGGEYRRERERTLRD
jgi:hypothetical protein